MLPCLQRYALFRTRLFKRGNLRVDESETHDGGRYYRSDRGWYEHGTPSVGPARAADWIFEKSKCDDRQEKGSEEQQKLDSKGEIMAEVFDRNNQHRPVP